MKKADTRTRTSNVLLRSYGGGLLREIARVLSKLKPNHGSAPRFSQIGPGEYSHLSLHRKIAKGSKSDDPNYRKAVIRGSTDCTPPLIKNISTTVLATELDLRGKDRDEPISIFEADDISDELCG